MKNPVYIASYARTPIGSFGGKLSLYSATDLGAHAIKAAMLKCNIPPADINEVIMGNVLSAGLGQNPARQAALKAGLNQHTICTTVNKVCASGMKALMYAAQSISLSYAHVVAAGGMESMSNVPYYLHHHRSGHKLGHEQLTDGVIHDGLWDAHHNYHMGNAAENTAKKYNITRNMQDEYAALSYNKAIEAHRSGVLNHEISPTLLSAKSTETYGYDEELEKVNFDKIPTLKPVFDSEGTITAANASSLNDGAAAMILASEEAVNRLNIKPLARIISFADAEQAPEWFTTSPSKAIPTALQRANLTHNDIDYYEINEAFAVVSIANNMLMELNPDCVNIYGGAVSVGHPLGTSGARIVCTLLTALLQNNKKYGVSAICNGGGGASAMILEKL
ncbi:MAG: acetyl-CoA C-acyltransferase [Cytophagales bacterium]|nr:acetyl-CoA C-acyltransferase [Cytophagales bacterium]